MIIKTIELENFKSHISTRVDLDTGISIIMGDNGAGKSSILESISFALFKEYVSKKMDKLINNEKSQMKVTVEFIANGRTYKVVRKRKRNSSPESMLYVEDDGRFIVIEKGDAAVSSEVERIIDLDKNLFLNAVYVRQGEIANLITKNPSEKKEMMGRLLGVDELENSWKNMKFVIDDYKNQEIRINGKLENLGNTEVDLKKRENEKIQLNDLIAQKEAELKESGNKLTKFEKIKEFFDKKEIEFNKASQKIEHEQDTISRLNSTKMDLSRQIEQIRIKEAEIQKLKPKIIKIELLESLKNKVSVLKELQKDSKYLADSLEKIETYKSTISKNEEFHHKYIDLEIQIRELSDSRKKFEGSDTLKDNYEAIIKNNSTKIVKLEKAISFKLNEYSKILDEEDITSIGELELYLENKKKDINDNFKQNLEQINEFNSKISDIRGRNKEIKRAIEELENAEDSCPVCESDLEENRRETLLKKYNEQIDKNKDTISSLEQNLGIWNSERKFLEEKNNKINNINIDVLKKYADDLENKIIELKEANTEFKQVDKSVQKLLKVDSELAEKNATLKDLEVNYKNYEWALKFLNEMENPEELLNSYNAIKKDIEPLESEINKLCIEFNVEMDYVNEELENLRKIKEIFDKLSGEISVKEEILNNLNRIEEDVKSHSIELENEKGKLAEISYESEKHDLAGENLKICQKEFEEIQRDLGVFKGQLKSTEDRITELKKQIQNYMDDKKELEKIGRFIELLNEIRKLYGKDGLQKDLRNRSRPLIENNTLEFFNKFNFEYSDIKLDENYDVTLFGPSGENTLDMISGGEIIAVALALRLGIAKTLVKGNLELMILDEPTVHLDSYRRHELIDVIKKLSVIPQMIIVTHDAGLEEAADNILRIRKENGISGIASI